MDVNTRSVSRSGQQLNQNQDVMDTQEVQNALHAIGYEIEADGILGPKTREAIRSFQEQHGLEPNGRIDQNLMVALEEARSSSESESQRLQMSPENVQAQLSGVHLERQLSILVTQARVLDSHDREIATQRGVALQAYDSTLDVLSRYCHGSLSEHEQELFQSEWSHAFGNTPMNSETALKLVQAMQEARNNLATDNVTYVDWTRLANVAPQDYAMATAILNYNHQAQNPSSAPHSVVLGVHPRTSHRSYVFEHGQSDLLRTIIHEPLHEGFLHQPGPNNTYGGTFDPPLESPYKISDFVLGIQSHRTFR